MLLQRLCRNRCLSLRNASQALWQSNVFNSPQRHYDIVSQFGTHKKRFDPGRIKPLILIKDFMLPLRSEISSLSGKNFTGYFHSFIYIVLSIRIVQNNKKILDVSAIVFLYIQGTTIKKENILCQSWFVSEYRWKKIF